jgi:hypothetical protein
VRLKPTACAAGLACLGSIRQKREAPETPFVK